MIDGRVSGEGNRKVIASAETGRHRGPAHAVAILPIRRPLLKLGGLFHIRAHAIVPFPIPLLLFKHKGSGSVHPLSLLSPRLVAQRAHCPSTVHSTHTHTLGLFLSLSYGSFDHPTTATPSPDHQSQPATQSHPHLGSSVDPPLGVLTSTRGNFDPLTRNRVIFLFSHQPNPKVSVTVPLLLPLHRVLTRPRSAHLCLSCGDPTTALRLSQLQIISSLGNQTPILQISLPAVLSPHPLDLLPVPPPSAPLPWLRTGTLPPLK